MIPEVSEEEWKANFLLTADYATTVKLPPSWSEHCLRPGHPLFGIRAYKKGGLFVLLDCSTFWDGTRWIHASCSRKDRMPTYEDLAEMKAVFFGPDRQALQVFPKKSKHVNIHPFCLHLWSCMDGDGLPDFGRYGTI